MTFTLGCGPQFTLNSSHINCVRGRSQTTLKTSFCIFGAKYPPMLTFFYPLNVDKKSHLFLRVLLHSRLNPAFLLVNKILLLSEDETSSEHFEQVYVFKDYFTDFQEAVSLEKIFEIVQKNTLKCSNLISFLGIKIGFKLNCQAFQLSTPTFQLSTI